MTTLLVYPEIIFAKLIFQATLENIENLLTRAKSTAKEKLLEAKQSCNNKLPQDPSFPYKEEFEALPTTMAALMEHSGELQTRIDIMDKGDDQVCGWIRRLGM